MNSWRVYLGTWLPRTHTHLMEVYNFIHRGVGVSLDAEQLKKHRRALDATDVRFEKHSDFDSVVFTSHGVTVSIFEDGVLLLFSQTSNTKKTVKEMGKLYQESLGPALAYLFSRGAPLPQTLIALKEVYPVMYVAEKVSDADIEKIFTDAKDEVFTTSQGNDAKIYFGAETVVIDAPDAMPPTEVDYLVAHMVFIQTYSDLLSNYLQAHRNVWEKISELKEARKVRFDQFGAIQHDILDHTRSISFVTTRLEQMEDILSSNKAQVSKDTHDQLMQLGFGGYDTLSASTRYLINLWKMTAEYAENTLKLYEGQVAEKTNVEIQLLQQFTIASVLIAFFSMNIAYPWDSAWTERAGSSYLVVFLVFGFLVMFSLILAYIVHRRKINLSGRKNK